MAQLQNRAMLVSIHAPGFTNSKKDRDATASTLASYGASADAGVFVKHLLPKEAYAAYNNAIMGLRLDFYRYSSPWLDLAGTRIMASSVYFEFMGRVQNHRTKIDTARAAFLASYDQYVSDQTRLARLYNPMDYPTREALASKFVCEVKTIPLADVQDWRLDDIQDVTTIREQVTKQVETALQKVTRANWLRAGEVIKELAEKLGGYTGERKGAFRDSVLDDICKLADLLPKMNLGDDPELDRLASEIKQSICQHSPEVLRTDENSRQSVIAECDRLLAGMAGYMGGDQDD